MAKHLLTPEARQLLIDYIDQVGLRRSNTPSRPGELIKESHQSTNVYIAYPPSGGIPAASGTTPGKAVCEIYKITNDSLGKVQSIKKNVYNLTETAVTQQYILVEKDKFGTYVAACPCSTVSACGGSCTVIPPNQYDVIISGVTDNICANCDEDVNGTHTCTYNGLGSPEVSNTCGWESVGTTFDGGLGCNSGSTSLVHVSIGSHPMGGDAMAVDLAGNLAITMARYEFVTESLDCLGTNILDLVSNDSTCDWPPTVTVKPT